MEKKKTPLLTPVLWFITTGLWTINLFISLRMGCEPGGSLLLKGLMAITSLAAAIVNLIRYKNGKKERKEA